MLRTSSRYCVAPQPWRILNGMAETDTIRPLPSFQLRHRLQLAIEFAGTSKEALAAYLDLSRQTIDNYLSGRTEPKVSTLRDWASACGVPASWLLTGSADSAEDTGRELDTWLSAA